MSQKLIRSIVDEDFVTAKELTSNLLYRAVSDRLDDVKREVAADLFTECVECGEGEEVSEGKMSANRYGGGKPFNFSKPHPSNALKGKQHKIDANKNGKIDAEDFKILRSKKG